MVRKKTLRLLLYDYQRTTRYYTIYRTSKSKLSDDFTTIPEAVTTISAGTLRLLLTSIGYRAKARKEIRRQPSIIPRRRAAPVAKLPRRVEGARLTRCALTVDRCQSASRRTLEASRRRARCSACQQSAHGRSRPRRAVMVCDVLRRLAWIYSRNAPMHSYIPYYIIGTLC